MADILAIRTRFLALSAHLDERSRRILAATEAKTAGYGGIAVSTIGRGLKELAGEGTLDLGRVRRPGRGGKRRME